MTENKELFLVCPVCRNTVARILPMKLSCPINGSMFIGKTPQYPDPWPAGNSWNTMYCPYSLNGIKHYPFSIYLNDKETLKGPIWLMTNMGDLSIDVPVDLARSLIEAGVMDGEIADFENICEFCGREFQSAHALKIHVAHMHRKENQ